MRRIMILVFLIGLILLSCSRDQVGENISRQDEAPYRGLTEEMGEVETERINDIYVHTYRGIHANYTVNTYIIETKGKLVVIDTQHLLSRAQEARAFVDYLDKPVDRVIVSHSHPDHYIGIEKFRDLPIYATKETVENMKEGAEELRQRNIALGEPYLGDYPDEILYPENIMESKFSVDGVEYEVIKTRDAEARDGIIIKIPQIEALFVGDLIEEGVHLAVLDPESYIDALKMVQGLEKEGYEHILSGHGGIYTFNVVEENLEYLYSVKEILGEKITTGEYKESIEKRYPDYGGADYVIGLMEEESDLFLSDEE